MNRSEKWDIREKDMWIAITAWNWPYPFPKKSE